MKATSAAAAASAAASAATAPSAPWPPRLSSARSRALACRQPPPAPSRPLPSVAASRGAAAASKGSNSAWNAPPLRPHSDDGKAKTTRAAASSSSSSSYPYRPDDYASAFDDEGTQFGTTGINNSNNSNDPSSSDDDRPPSLWRRALAAAAEAAASPAAAAAAQVGQTAASLLFVVLYVWSTYSSPPPGGFRQLLDAGLCFVFAADYMIRLARAESKLRMICSFWNILDALAVFPPLIELFVGGGGSGTAAAAAAAAAASNSSRSSRARASLGTLRGSSFDFRWFKALRALRVMRVALLAGELGSMHASSSGRLLASAASVRLFQLVASVATLLFTTSAVVNLVERMPFHDALYFVTTTLTTVGYGDVVVKSTAGKFAVLVMILLGVIIIPAQSSALWAQLQARRVTLGPLPAQWRKQPHVLVSARLSDVRGFSDFLMEFFAAGARAAAAATPADDDGSGSGGGSSAENSASLRAAASSPLLEAPLPRNARMVVLGGKPDFEFRALQELNDRRLTLVEGSALSERDLARTRAEAAAGVLLLADRFSPSPAQEDLNVLFQVWAVKSYTRSPRLYVQVLQRRSLQAVRPFLDPSRDVLVSVEQTRHRLLALSALCPGASTLLANLLRRAAVPPPPPLPGQLQQQKQKKGGGGGGGGGNHGGSGGKSSVEAAAASQQQQQRRTAGGRRWLRSYMNGCGNKIHVVRLAAPSLAGVPFADAAAAMHAATGVLMIGVMRGGGRRSSSSPSSPGAASFSSSSSSSSSAVAGTVLNPGRRLLRGGDSAVVICATGAAGARAAAALDYSEWLLRLPGRGGGGEAARGRSGSRPVNSSSIDYVAASASESLDPSASVDGDASAAAAAAAAIALGSLRASAAPEGWGAAAALARWARAPFDLVGGVASAVVGAVAPERKARREEEKRRRRRRKAALAAAAAAAASASASAAPAAGAAKRSKTSGGAVSSSSSWGSDDADMMPPPPEGVDCASVPVETESVDWEEGECDVESLLPKGDGDGGGAAAEVSAQSPATFGETSEQPNPAKATKSLGSPALSTSSFDDSAGYVDDEFYFAAERPRGSKEAAAAAKSSAAEPAATAAAASAAAAEGGALSSSSPSTSSLLPAPKPRFSNHIIIAGADASFLAFAEQVRASDPLASTTPLVILSAYRPSDLGAIAALGGPVFWIRGDAASAEGLSAAAAASARALVYLALPQRPGGGEGIGSLGGGGGAGMGAGQRGGTAEGVSSSSPPPASSSSPGGVVVQPDGRVAFVPGAAAPSSPSGAAASSSSTSSPDKAAAWASIAASAPFEDPSLPSSSAAVFAAGAGAASGGGEAASAGRADRAAASRSAVLADAPGLLCCYGAGEVDGSATPPYAVIELCFTSSLRFLQPGLLLKGVSAGVPSDDFGWRKRRSYSANSSAAAAAASSAAPSSSSYSFNNTSTANHAPRRSWLARKRQEKAAAAEGLAAWQANPYYAAGRVTVPAGMDAFACAGFFGGAGLLPDIMAELAGDDGRPGGAALRSVPVPPQLVGATYGSLFARFAGRRRLVPLGLYRRKSENATWRLSYVVTNPPPGTRLERGDRVFVLRERGGPWLAGPSADDDDSEGFGGQGVGGSESDGEEM